MCDGNEETDCGSAVRLSDFRGLFPSIMLPMFLAMLDQTIVASALPSIVGELGDVERVSWIVVSYLMAATIAAPVYGRVGDFFGRRRVLFIALAAFVIASAACAASRSIPVLAFARVLQGLGGGGLMTLSQALIGEVLPPRDRARHQGYLATAAVGANAFGPVAGGYLTQHLGWQWIFLINIPLGAVAALLLLRLPAGRGSSGKFHTDALGLLLFACCVIATLSALQRVHRFSIEELSQTVGLLLAAAAAAVCLHRVERRAKSPIIPIALLSRPTIWRSNALAACHGATLVSLLTFLPIYLHVVRRSTAAEIGVLLLPLTFCVGIGALITGHLVSRTGRTAIFPSIGLVIVVASLAVLASSASSLTNSALMILLAVMSLFMGTVMGVVQVTIQTDTSQATLGAAAGSVQFSRSIGAAVGTSIVSGLFFVSLSQADPNTVHLLRVVVEAGSAPGGNLSRADFANIHEEVISAFRFVFSTICTFASAGMMLAWSIPLRRL